MDLRLRDTLPRLVQAKYLAAKQSKALTFSETELVIQHEPMSGLPFQIRYCPALARKPKANEKTQAQSKDHKPFDPFEDPSQDLLIAEVPGDKPTHSLVLNKYPIIPQHFIVATKDFKEQTDLLDPTDLDVTYSCLNQWESEGSDRRLLAFFNSGSDSGASQPHRHVQFVPVEEMARDVPTTETWQPLVDTALRRSEQATGTPPPGSPFRLFVRPIPAQPTSSTLHDLYLDLIRSCFGLGTQAAVSNTLTQTSSYNLAMTTSAMAIVKRARESHIYTDESGTDHPIAINGTILAGTLMVKREAEWDWLRRDPQNLAGVLRSITESVSQRDKL